MSDVYNVPNLKSNILSVGQLLEKNYDIHFKDRSATIRNQEGKLIAKSRTGDEVFPGDNCRPGNLAKRQKSVRRGTNSDRLFSQSLEESFPGDMSPGKFPENSLEVLKLLDKYHIYQASACSLGTLAFLEVPGIAWRCIGLQEELVKNLDQERLWELVHFCSLTKSDHSVGGYYTARMVGPHMDITTDFMSDVARGHGGDGGGDDRPPHTDTPVVGLLGQPRPSLTCVPTWNPIAGHLSMQPSSSIYKRSTMARRLLLRKSIGFLIGLGLETGAHRQSLPSHISDRSLGYADCGSRSIAALRDMHMESSATREDEMLRLQGLGSNTETGVPYTEDEIMAIVRGGKQRGHILGVGRVLPGQRTVIPPSPPCTHSSDVAKLKKREKVLTRQGGSGSGGCGDDEQGDDEDDGEDGEDEDDKLVILVNIDLYLADNASFVTSEPCGGSDIGVSSETVVESLNLEVVSSAETTMGEYYNMATINNSLNSGIKPEVKGEGSLLNKDIGESSVNVVKNQNPAINSSSPASGIVSLFPLKRASLYALLLLMQRSARKDIVRPLWDLSFSNPVDKTIRVSLALGFIPRPSSGVRIRYWVRYAAVESEVGRVGHVVSGKWKKELDFIPMMNK
ncbi:hypothetical protein Tco_0517926 [Tanacetum coccineum]